VPREAGTVAAIAEAGAGGEYRRGWMVECCCDWSSTQSRSVRLGHNSLAGLLDGKGAILHSLSLT
jgi:hypothetical protein